MAEASLQQVRRGRKLLSMDLSVDDISPSLPQEPLAIPQQASAEADDVAPPAQTLCSFAAHSPHMANSDSLPASLEEHASSLTSIASDLSRISTRIAKDALSNRDAPALHAPRATPGGQSSIQLGPIRQPLQGGLPRNPFYIARALTQAPLQQAQQLHSGWNAVQLLESQQQLQRTLAAAHAVGYAQGVRQGAALSQRQAPLRFSKEPCSSTAQDQHDRSGHQAGLAASQASGQKRTTAGAGFESSSTKRQRLVHIAEPQHSVPPPSQGLVKFKCSIADMIDALWPAEAAQEAPRQHTAQAPSTACSFQTAPQSSDGQEPVKPAPGEALSCMAVPNLSLGRGPSRRLLSVPPCLAPANSNLPLPPQIPAATADTVAASTAAVESLTIDPEAQARRSMLPPQRATAQSLHQRVAAAQAAGWADFSLTAFASGLHVPLTNSMVTSQSPQGSASAQMQGVDSTISQAGAAQAPGLTLSSFPQVMSQLLSEPSMQVMQAWAVAYQPPLALPNGQQDVLAANASASRPQKRARQGEDDLQASTAGPAAAAATAASIFGNVPAQQHPQLSSIQLLHLRAQQHMADASASSASSSAAASNANRQIPLGGAQPDPQTGVQFGSGSSDLPWGPHGETQLRQWGSAPSPDTVMLNSASPQSRTGSQGM